MTDWTLSLVGLALLLAAHGGCGANDVSLGTDFGGVGGSAALGGAPGGAAIGSATGGATLGDATGGAALGDATGGAALGDATGGTTLNGSTGGATLSGATGGTPLNAGGSGGATLGGATGGTPLNAGGSGAGERSTGGAGNGSTNSTSGGTAAAFLVPGSGATRGRPVTQDNDRPEPTWLPDIRLATSGWQASNVPYCNGTQGVSLTSFGVWADDRGVFVSTTAECLTPGAWCDGRFTLQFNDGSGWQGSLADSVPNPVYPSTNRLSGFPDGPAMLLGYATFDFRPRNTAPDSLIFIDKISPSLPSPTTYWELAVQPRLGALDGAAAVAAYAVGPDHAYVVVQENSDPSASSVHEYVSGTWRKLATLPTKAHAIWGDGELVLVAGEGNGLFARASGADDFARLPGVPTGDYFSVFAFGGSDLWAGNEHGELVHFDGVSWQAFPTGTVTPIQRLWGSDGAVFYISSSEFGRADESGIDALASNEAGLRFWDLWGKSSAEVFLTVTDSTLAPYACGEQRLLWYDGAEFHQF